MPVYIRGAAKEYLDMFGRGDETRNVAILIHDQTGADTERLLRRAIDRGSPLSDDEIVDDFLNGEQIVFDDFMKWYQEEF